MRQDIGQLCFDGLLAAAAEDNRKRKTERETAHLPGTMEEAIPYCRLLIRQHHAAVLAADAGKVDAAPARGEEPRLAPQRRKRPVWAALRAWSGLVRVG